jgi:hypothetical protein
MGNCCPQKDDTISFSTSFSFSSSSSSSFTPSSFPSFPSIIRQSSNENEDTIDFDAIIADYHRRHPKPEVKQEEIPLPPIKRQNCVYNIA